MRTFGILLGCVAVTYGVGPIIMTARDVVNFDYTAGANGPSNWQTLFMTTAANVKFPGCGGAGVNPRQSPIDISTKTAVKPSVDPGWLNLTSHSVKMQAISLNTGRNLAFHFGTTAGTPRLGPALSGGPLSKGKVYLFDHGEMHWGPSSLTGSEHTIDAKAAPAELQLVYIDSQYANLAAASAVAVSQPDAVVVVSFLAEVNNSASNGFESLFGLLPGATTSTTAASSTALPPFSLLSLLPISVERLESYYYYLGGMTRPGSAAAAAAAGPAGTGCEDVVQWIIAEDKIQITDTQLASLRGLVDEAAVGLVATTSNSRPIQSLGTRTVNKRSATPDASAATVTPNNQAPNTIGTILASTIIGIGTYVAASNLFTAPVDDTQKASKTNPLVDLIENFDKNFLQEEPEERQEDQYDHHQVHQLHHGQRY